MDRGPGTWLLWLVAAALIVLAGMRLLGGGGEPEPVRVTAPGPGAPGAGAASGAPSRAGPGGLFVHVAGRVRRPGLYRLRPGERVAAAIERAGGPARRADLAKVNLAARVEDGQQVVVPRLGSTPAGATVGAGEPGSGAGAKLSLASATEQQLDGLDGIGPTLAKRIVEFRQKHGGFRSIGQLRDVEGIGDKRFEALREALGP